ncbi:MAG TPA: pectate lyase, partial [Tepidisphaeraceae bacterium]|nr:pectate lyase [Tepidisphaeraceae bacterium]
QIWVQPPGTPAVGQTFVRAYRATKEGVHLEAVRAAADALAYGQLESGGWHYMVDFDPPADRSYRRALAKGGRGAGKLKNVTTFDDNVTQSATRLLMDVAFGGLPADADAERAARIDSALKYALDGFARAQYPIGAFPQAYMGGARNAADFPVKQASVPNDWKELSRIKEYWFHYTLNDDTHADCLRLLLDAGERLRDDRLLAAARKAGDFLLLAQLPAPHPAWAQQYNPADMRPAWARKFEPPAVCTHESAFVVRTLTDLYLHTGEEKYLAPIPAALDWLDKVKLPGGRWSRFYELNTNKPLYMNTRYEVVYTDDDLPTHYGFQGEYGIASAQQHYEAVKAVGRDAWLAKQKAAADRKPAVTAKLEERVTAVIGALDEKGRWLDKDGRISCRLFNENARVLCDYLLAVG